ncbi:photosynthetic NDH subunit of subcomplex B 4, chloroplastic isoform X2 [Manihot esculenta]|uniref:photosynthetic NDH subunit of subcomplex B 4, chloroplastic isoform X2 n=1 Tax=Manihot esculenta TaxID=3983 RepID=UPI001CC7DF8D|nr:photosynthetic NDH subunit of subcomplex B 4, chloroplastic isoform X2 [Manihot esculenta]
MVEAIMGFTIAKPHICNSFQSTKLDFNPSSRSLRQCSSSRFFTGWQQPESSSKSKRGSLSKVNAFPDWHLMAVLVDHMDGQRDLVTYKSIWHLSDQAIKNVYVFYIMFTCWGCLFFGSMKDPYYDSDAYRKDGGDGSGHWVYEKQEDIEESARAELWREELIEEIEQKVGGLRELEEAGRK